MASTMPACRKFKSFPGHMILLLWLTALSSHTLADGIEIESATLREINGIFTLHAQLTYDLTEVATDALSHGIPLTFVVRAKINRRRDYIWDLTIYSSRQDYRLEYHALTEQYLVTNQVTGQRRIFLSLGSATQNLGHISMALGEKEKLKSVDNLYAEVQVELDIESLPAPLRPIAYFSPQWHISSPVHQLPVP